MAKRDEGCGKARQGYAAMRSGHECVSSAMRRLSATAV